MDRNIPWDLIIRKFKHEISAEEQTELEVWFADKANHTLFLELQSVWLSLMAEGTNYVSEVDILWKRMELNIKEKEPKIVKMPLSSFRWLLGVASVFLLLLFSATSYVVNEWYQTSSAVLTYSSLNGKSKVILPDGTKVWLNAESTLEYSTSLWSKKRNVFLKGEAYFEVAKYSESLMEGE